MTSRVRMGLFGRATAAATLRPAMLQRDRTTRASRDETGLQCAARPSCAGEEVQRAMDALEGALETAGCNAQAACCWGTGLEHTRRRLGGGARLHTASEDQVGVSECPLAVKSEQNHGRRQRAVRVESVQRSTELGRHPGRIHVQRERAARGRQQRGSVAAW
jgi:hypothetical protein